MSSSPSLLRRALKAVERFAHAVVGVGFAAVVAGYGLGWLSPHVALFLGAGAAAVVYAALLINRALQIHAAARSFEPCRGVGFSGMGVLLGGASIAAAAVLERPVAPYVAGGGVLAASLCYVLGLLLLPGGPSTVLSRIRWVLDGAAVGICLVFAGWVLVVAPLTPDAPDPVGREASAALVLVMVLSAALTVTALAGVRASAGRASVLLCSGGAAVALIEHAVLTLVLTADGSWPWALASAVGWAVGPAMIWTGVWRSSPDVIRERPPELGASEDPARALAMLSPLVLAALLAFVAALYQMSATGGFRGHTAVIALSAATAVGVRGAWSAVEIYRYASRVAVREGRSRTTDWLTGSPNRLRLRHRLERLRGQVDVGQQFAVLLAVDLDNFGELDEVQGHEVGDLVLMEVARRIRVASGPSDMTARLAGDAFAVLTATAPEQADELANRLLSALAAPYPIHDRDSTAHLTASIGIAECNSAASVDEMIRAAELAVISAQELGGNQIARYGESLAVSALRRLTYAQALPGAASRGELDLVYQPVVSLRDGAPVGLAAQIRWLHPTLGVARSDDLRQAADDSGLVAQLNEWTLRTLCQQARRWRADGRDLWVSVEVSPLQLRVPSFPDELRRMLGDLQLPPRRLALEVSEQAMGLYDLAAPLGSLRAAGVRTVVNGFGVGRCPLARLATAPIDLVKLDASALAEPAQARLIAEVAGVLARQLGVQVIADGVAEKWQAELSDDLECHLAQGAWYSLPGPAERAEAYLDSHRGGTDSASLRQ